MYYTLVNSQENYLYRGTLTKLRKGIKAAHQENLAPPPSWILRHTAKKTRLVVMYTHHADTTQFPESWSRERSWTLYPGLCVTCFCLCSRDRFPCPLRQHHPMSHPFLYSQHVAFQHLVWIVRASAPCMRSPCSQPSFVAQTICLQYLPTLNNSSEETLN